MLSLERWAGGQPARDPVYRISRESGLDPKGYRSRIGRDMLPSERLANRDPKSTGLAMVPSHHLGSWADLEIHPLALPQTVSFLNSSERGPPWATKALSIQRTNGFPSSRLGEHSRGSRKVSPHKAFPS